MAIQDQLYLEQELAEQNNSNKEKLSFLNNIQILNKN